MGKALLALTFLAFGACATQTPKPEKSPKPTMTMPCWEYKGAWVDSNQALSELGKKGWEAFSMEVFPIQSNGRMVGLRIWAMLKRPAQCSSMIRMPVPAAVQQPRRRLQRLTRPSS